jgi:nitrate reductase gamma subunit
MAPTYLFDIGITIVAIGFVIGMLSLFVHYIITKVSK